MSETKNKHTRRTKVTTEIAVNPCTLLDAAAEAAAQRAESGERGSTLESMSAILLATFAVEAYLNHLADQLRARDTFARELRDTGLNPEHIWPHLRQQAPDLTLEMLLSNLDKPPMAAIWAGERKMKFLEKLGALMAWVDLPYDAAGDPTVQCLVQMSRMRSSLVHGKTVRAKSTVTKTVAHNDTRGSFEHADKNLEPIWRRMSTPRIARRSVDAGDEIQRRLSVAAGYGEYHFGLGYLGTVDVVQGD